MAAKRRRRPRGRPNGGGEEVVRAVLEATRKQIEERGFAGLSVDEIARAAGVNKASGCELDARRTQCGASGVQ
jgi:AcrR family transcriptional regulator